MYDLVNDHYYYPTTNHIKAHISLKGLPNCIKQLSQALKEKKNKKRKRNFIVLKEFYTYTIFPACGFINIANIKNWEDLKNIVPAFASSFGIKKKR